jgi:hypothetical protein
MFKRNNTEMLNYLHRNYKPNWTHNERACSLNNKLTICNRVSNICSCVPLVIRRETLLKVITSVISRYNNLPTHFTVSGTLKSDSTHHFFRNACTKSGSLRFSQFSDCWLLLSVYIILSFDFPFVRLFRVW